MKTLVCKTPGKLEIMEMAKPDQRSGYSIIRITRIGICGTDLHAFEGTQPYFNYPRVLGHELAGELVDVDGTDDFRKGEIVTFIPYWNCGTCAMCRQGRTNCCQNLKVFGVHIDGGMAEFLSVPSRLLLKVPGLSHDEIALIEPLAIAAHAVRRADVQPGENVVVMGAGPIGLGIVQFAKMKRAEIIVFDVNEDRLAFCRDKYNIGKTINPLQPNAVEQMAHFTHQQSASVVFDATGNLKALQQGFEYMGHGARYILVGLQSQPITFSHPDFHKKEGTLMSSRNATREDFETVIQAIASRAIDPLKMVTHRVPFEEVADCFADWLNPSNQVIKVIVELD